MNNKLVHVLPCGGYTKVIDLADDVITHNLLGKKASVSIVLDGDIRDKAEQYRIKQNIGNNIPLNFLPIESLEKYLRNKLFLNVDHKLFRQLNDYVFQNKSLTELIDTYKKRVNPINDKDGKILFGIIDTELRERRVERSELVVMVVDYLFESQDSSLNKLISFLQNQLES